ncbi:MAG: hypothetical protein ACAI18_00725, partial [Gemmatimonadales bacterium]
MSSHAQQLSVLVLSGLILVACDQAPTAPGDAAAERLPDRGLAALANTWVNRANLPKVERTALTTAVVTNAAGQSVLYAIGGRS